MVLPSGFSKEEYVETFKDFFPIYGKILCSFVIYGKTIT